MDEQGMLRHLLEIESDAASLVFDAQSEADRRVAENEKVYRSRFDNRYEEEVSLLEKKYQDAVSQVKAQYDEELRVYREMVQSEKLNQDAFVKLAESFLFKGE